MQALEDVRPSDCLGDARAKDTMRMSRFQLIESSLPTLLSLFKRREDLRRYPARVRHYTVDVGNNQDSEFPNDNQHKPEQGKSDHIMPYSPEKNPICSGKRLWDVVRSKYRGPVIDWSSLKLLAKETSARPDVFYAPFVEF
ncbi:hypothetical protein BFJ65_g6716 [Fusarium oxysporum f. sp. cepae]|jgi:hypothetical protein|uniref:Uncharacterized protein n=1 Tax=Fusarium oxysporum f. sp. cepae TaxID=396571 RepID=A0A3L6NQ95_FUSOX|nr:hypothetical protein BFJ65_g6716 [Fusarium oxysporum f. sp. cepae]